MDQRISGRTKLLGLFGTPVGHSGSPAMYNFSFWHDNIDCAYLAFDVNVEGMKRAFDAVRILNMKGGNFTMPCKNIAAELVDKLSPAAEIVGACNTFVNEDGVITGYITDGVGFVLNLEKNGVSVKDKNVVILGAGGAATAIQVQLALDGAKEVHIFNIEDEFLDRAKSTKAKIEERVPSCKVTVTALKKTENPAENVEVLAEKIKNADILINGTIIGMKPYHEQTLVDKSLFHKNLVVADTVYNPEKTRMILEAEEIGCKVVGGAGMLIGQGAVNYKLFTGKEMPIEEFQKFKAENK